MTDADVRALLGVLGPHQSAAPQDIFYADVLTGLRELIPCQQMGFQLMDVAGRCSHLLFVTDEGVQRAEGAGPDTEFHRLWWQEYWERGGFAGPVATGDYTTLLHQRDLCWPRSWAETPLGSAYAAMGITDHLLVPMSPLGGIDRRLGLFRSEDMPFFSERDKAMLALARPHLAELHACRDRELRGVPHLTARQWDVLREVARGASNTQIAHTLGVSGATVGKHLENAYERLGVQSRTEAVAAVRAFLDVA
jgi:DNA-binding CsgD family transcriptional regulator